MYLLKGYILTFGSRTSVFCRGLIVMHRRRDQMRCFRNKWELLFAWHWTANPCSTRTRRQPMGCAAPRRRKKTKKESCHTAGVRIKTIGVA